MTVHVLVSGSLFKNPETKIARSGKSYASASIRTASADNSTSDFWNLLIFSETVAAELMQLREGDKLSAQGSLKLEIYNGKISRSVFVDAILPLRRERKPKAAAVGSKAADAAVKQSIDEPSSAPPFDDDIPFAPGVSLMTEQHKQVRRTKAGALTEKVARLLFGAPTMYDAEKGTQHYGEHTSVNLKTGKFFDFEDEIGGTHIELIQRVKNLQNGEAEAWLKDNVIDAKPLPLPAESEAERALVGLLAMRPEMMAAIEEEITADHLAEIVHRQLFTAIAQAEQIAGKPVSMKALMDAAGGDPLLPVFDGYTLAGYVAKLVADAPSPPDAAHFARELAVQIRSAANREGGVEDQYDVEQAPEPPPAWFLSKREFISGFVAPDYLLDGILQRRFIYALTAQTGHGKTAFALLIARLVGGSDGKAALGKHAAEKGQVVYFAGENPDDLRMRVLGDTALCEDDAARIWFIPGTFSIEAMREKIEAEIKRLGGVDLVIIDTSAAYFNGKDELSNTEMGAHARMLRTLTTLPGGPCVLALCHPVKHVTDPSQLLPRGGGAFIAEVDGNLTIWKHDGVLLDLHHTDKLRGPGFEPISLRLETITTTRLIDKKGRLMPTVRAAWISDAETARETEDARGDEDVLLQAMLIPGLSIADLAKACNWTTSKGEPHKSKVDRTMKRLFADKLVAKKRSTWALTEAGKKAAEIAVTHRNQRDLYDRRYPT